MFYVESISIHIESVKPTCVTRGSIYVSASGGSGGYQIFLVPSNSTVIPIGTTINGLSQDIFTVLVKDS